MSTIHYEDHLGREIIRKIWPGKQEFLRSKHGPECNLKTIINQITILRLYGCYVSVLNDCLLYLHNFY